MSQRIVRTLIFSSLVLAAAGSMLLTPAQAEVVNGTSRPLSCSDPDGFEYTQPGQTFFYWTLTGTCYDGGVRVDACDKLVNGAWVRDDATGSVRHTGSNAGSVCDGYDPNWHSGTYNADNRWDFYVTDAQLNPIPVRIWYEDDDYSDNTGSLTLTFRA